MQVRFENGQGFLYVEDNEGEILSYPFDRQTLPYWYPISVSYHYEWDEESQAVQLNSAPLIKQGIYGIQDGETEHLEYPVPLDVSEWRCEPVVEENRKIIRFAKKFGAPDINEEFTLEDVEQAYQNVVDKIEDPIQRKLQEKEFMGKTPDEIEMFKNQHWVTQVRKLHKHLTEEDEVVLRLAGCVRIWLNVLRRSVM